MITEMKKLNVFRFMPKVFVITLGVGLMIATALFIGQWRGFRKNSASQEATGPTQVQTVQVNSVKEMNQVLAIPLAGIKEDIQYEVSSAELLEEINLRGQKVRAAGGRVFLVLNVKVTNPNIKGIQINSRDFVRVSWGESGDWIAPDIHNDPVEVQAISTKQTRIGFAVDNTVKNFRLKIGEIKGDKTDFELAF
jgi:hypothetical protein